jgi:hypothetical protein
MEENVTKRQPKGTPVGGQFAEDRKPEGPALGSFTNPDFGVRDAGGSPTELIRDNVKVELEDIGEGISGEYDENNPEDVSLLRFYVSVRGEDGEWEAVDDASYCTNLPTDLPDFKKKIALNALMNEFHNVLANDPTASVKGLGEQMSWIAPEDLKVPPLTITQSDVATAYKMAALWASLDDDGEPLDLQFSPADIAPESDEQINAEVVEFWEKAKAEGLVDGVKPAQFGHDFFLTRAGHGAGFWDRGRGYAGERLTEMAKSYRENTPIKGDDGKIYFE